MYYQRKPTILFRNYGDFGYLTDNRNFGYRMPNDPIVGDVVLSQSGAILVETLGKTSMTVEQVADAAMERFVGVDFDVLVEDVYELFDFLANRGFLVKIDEKGVVASSEYNRNRVHRVSSSCGSQYIDISTQAFFHQHFGNDPFPTCVHLEIASICNERCVHCYIPHEFKTGLMPFEMIKGIVEQCKDMNILHVTLSGGEPLLHPDFVRVLSLCKDNDFSVNVLSNLTELDEEIVSEMASNPLLGVQASLYSMDEEVHDAITGIKGSCKKTVDSILRLVDRHVPVQISCPIMKQNYASYTGVKEWGMKTGVPVSADYVIIGKCDGSNENLQCRLCREEIESVLVEDLRDSATRDALKEEVKINRLRSQDEFICGVCGSSMCIGVDGSVFPCAGWEGCVLGNINESTLKDIWYHSDKAIRLRNLKRKDFIKCSSCDCSDYCVLCLVRNANESKESDPLEVNEFFCEVAKLKKRIVESR